jgi:hypothetical protein
MRIKNILKKIILVILFVIFTLAFIDLQKYFTLPKEISYGASFSKLHSDDLKLDWKKVYDAALDDLKVRKFRLSAHWTETEPKNDEFNFEVLDYQMKRAEETNSKVILSVGLRLPGWPECHKPGWFDQLPSKEEKQKELLEYISRVVNRYKDSPALLYWQVENEPFLLLYARHHCEDFFETDFFEQEISLVRLLDRDTPIMSTDSGELSLWYQAYTRSDVFGTSIYLYVWNHKLGPIRYPITSDFFRIKRGLVEMFFGKKPMILSELSAEPWLLQPIVDTPIDEQFKQMNIERFDEMVNFAKKTSFDTQLLWGLEWWYWLKENGHPEFWERAKELYR